jgi:hypothetical protein
MSQVWHLALKTLTCTPFSTIFAVKDNYVCPWMSFSVGCNLGFSRTVLYSEDESFAGSLILV